MRINKEELSAYVFILSNGVNCPARGFSRKILNETITREDCLDITQFLHKSGKCCIEACVTGALWETFLSIQENIPKKINKLIINNSAY